MDEFLLFGEYRSNVRNVEILVKCKIRTKLIERLFKSELGIEWKCYTNLMKLVLEFNWNIISKLLKWYWRIIKISHWNRNKQKCIIISESCVLFLKMYDNVRGGGCGVKYIYTFNTRALDDGLLWHTWLSIRNIIQIA